MKIILTGAHNVGKTTFCEYMFEKYNFPFIKEYVNTLIEYLKFDISKIEDSPTTMLFQSTLYFIHKRKHEYFKEFSNIIMDRFALDVMAYTIYNRNNIRNLCRVDEKLQKCIDIIEDIYKEVFVDLEKLIHDIKNNIDIIIFCRNINKKDNFQSFIDSSIEGLLKRYDMYHKVIETYKYPKEDMKLINKIIDLI